MNNSAEFIPTRGNIAMHYLYEKQNVEISYPSGALSIYFPLYFARASTAQVRKLYKLLFTYRYTWINEEAVKIFNAGFPKVIAEFDEEIDTAKATVNKWIGIRTRFAEGHYEEIPFMAAKCIGDGHWAKKDLSDFEKDINDTLLAAKSTLTTLERDRKAVVKSYTVYKEYKQKYAIND